MRFIFKFNSKNFGHGGPFNPHRYKTNFVPKNYPTNKEAEDLYLAYH